MEVDEVLIPDDSFPQIMQSLHRHISIMIGSHGDQSFFFNKFKGFKGYFGLIFKGFKGFPPQIFKGF